MYDTEYITYFVLQPDAVSYSPYLNDGVLLSNIETQTERSIIYPVTKFFIQSDVKEWEKGRCKFHPGLGATTPYHTM